MYNGIGLQTPRGSGTNGHIQSNKFFVRPKTGKVVLDNNKGFDAGQGTAGLTKKPNKDILDHDRKRQIQLKLLVLKDKLLDQGYTDSEISEKLDEARKTQEAVSASEEAGGLTAIVLSDKKFSNTTQTHQIALRKEKQMETLKAALGIGSELDNRKKQDDASEEDNDDGRPRNSGKKASSDDVKGHVKDIRDQNDDMKKVVKNKNGSVRDRHGKKESKTRDEDSNDSDGSEKSLERTKKHKKHGKGIDSNYDSDIDVRKKKMIEKSSSKHKKKRHDSEDSEYEYESDYEEKHGRARKRHDSDDDGPSSDDSPKRNTPRVKQLSKRSKRRDSEDESDSDSGEEDERKHLERKRHKHGGRSAVEIESGYDKATKNKKEKVQKSGRMQHDPDEDDSRDECDTGSREEGERQQLERKRHQHGGRYAVEIESGYDKATKNEKDKVEKSRRRRHDTDEDDSDTDVDGKVKRSQKSRRHDFYEDGNEDSESDKSRKKRESGRWTSKYRHEKVIVSKPVEKRGSDREYGRSGKGGRGLEEKAEVDTDDRKKEKHGHHNVDDASNTFKKLEDVYQSRRDTNDGSVNVNRETMKDKWKDENDKDNQRRHDYSKFDRYGRGREDENSEHEIRIQDYEEHGWGTRPSRDEEDHGKKHKRDEEDRGRKHKRDEEEDVYRKHGKDGDHKKRRYGREIEEEHGSTRYERDRQLDSSKRARNDDSQSSNGRRYDDRRVRR